MSRAVNAAISFKPLYALMKVGAKQVLKGTAERNGIPWDAAVHQLQNTPEVRLHEVGGPADMRQALETLCRGCS